MSWLVDARFHVTVADEFADAKARLSERPPTLLVTEVRLGAYNGLELVLRGKARHPSMAAVVLSGAPDAVLQADAEAMGATFVVTPLAPAEIRAAVFRTLFRTDASMPIRPPFERRSVERRHFQSPVGYERRRNDRRQFADDASVPANRGAHRDR